MTDATSFDLTPAQTKAVDDSLQFANTAGPESQFVVSGLAGTGKTTALVKIVEALKDAGFRPAVCTPTGKAAHVINKKQGVFTATTLHKVLCARPVDRTADLHARLDQLDMYEQSGDITEDQQAERQTLLRTLDLAQRDGNTLGFVPVEIEDFMDEYNMLVFDESSMIGKQHTYNPLISRIPVPKFFFGDGSQLPPVKDTPAINMDRPNVRFDQILRQKEGSGIIPFSHYITKIGDYPASADCAQFNDLTIVKSGRIDACDGFEDHQILCWRNKTRNEVAMKMRLRRGFDYAKEEYPYLPLPGERLMIDQNDDTRRLLKGQLMTVKRTLGYNPRFNPFIVTCEMFDDKGALRTMAINLADLAEGHAVVGCEDEAEAIKYKRWAAKLGVNVMFDYALTVHKSQGSEWDKVFVLGEMGPKQQDWRRWAYTAATRAAKHLTWAASEFRYE